jgi:hypothetical protein
MRTRCAILPLFAVIGLAESARAHGMPNVDCPRISDWSLGVSVAHGWHPDRQDGALYGVDAAFFPGCIAWAGGGLRVFENLRSQDRTLLPYVEAGAWLLLNVGVGYSIDVTHGSAAPTEGSGFHLFLGEPIPLFGTSYVEPYYRATFIGPDALNELGVMVKWTTWDFRLH